MDNLMLHPMVQGHENSSNQNHHTQIFPGFSLSDAINTLFEYKENEFKEHQEGEEANDPDRGGRYPE